MHAGMRPCNWLAVKVNGTAPPAPVSSPRVFVISSPLRVAMASRVMVPKDQRPKLPQAEWDEAVTTNIEDFDMSVSAQVRRPTCRSSRGCRNLPPCKRITPMAPAVITSVCGVCAQPEEAVEAAKKEFEMQGYDLSTVIMKASGGDVAS
jgi:hypothetical protein